MSVNTAHANGGVLIHSGEYILLHSKNASINFSGQSCPSFRGMKHGHIYLTSHRMIFISKRKAESLLSFSAPFSAMDEIELQQPASHAHHIKGKINAQQNGNFTGEIRFQLYLTSGGVVPFAQALICAASIVVSIVGKCRYPDTPPYTAPRAWYEAPVAAYQPRPGYFDWLPHSDAFTNPTPNSVYMVDNPAPYPGIGTPSMRQNSCESFAVPPNGGRCPTPKHSFEGYGQPPVYATDRTPSLRGLNEEIEHQWEFEQSFYEDVEQGDSIKLSDGIPVART